MERRNHKFSLLVFLLGLKLNTVLVSFPSSDNLVLAKLFALSDSGEGLGVCRCPCCASLVTPVLDLPPFPWAGCPLTPWLFPAEPGSCRGR